MSTTHSASIINMTVFSPGANEVMRWCFNIVFMTLFGASYFFPAHSPQIMAEQWGACILREHRYMTSPFHS